MAETLTLESGPSFKPISDYEKLDLTMRIQTLKLKSATNEEVDMQTRKAAQVALDHYNRKYSLKTSKKKKKRYAAQSVKYVLDEPLNSNGFLCGGKDVIHVNFTAKVDGDASGTPHHFFAEITFNRRVGSFRVRDCAVFDPSVTSDDIGDPVISEECLFCSRNFEKPILHPAGHYALGLYDADYYDPSEYDTDDSDDIFD